MNYLCFIRKAFPSIVRGFLPWLGISFYSKGFHSIVRESFRPFAPCVWIWVWCCLVVVFSRRFLENQTNILENQKYKRKPKKTKRKPSGKPKNTVFKRFRPTLGYGFVFFGLLVFPKVFRKQKKHQENQTYKRKPKKTKKNFGKTKKTKFLKVSDPPLDICCCCCCCCCFPEGV